MNKTKVILAATGGVSVLAALGIGYFVFGVVAENVEVEESIETAESEVRTLIGAKVFPDREGLRSVETNRVLFAAWADEAFAFASRGDLDLGAGGETTPPAFKARMVREAKELAEQPGTADGRLVAADFGFGFGNYITGGHMPSPADLPRLMREWTDVRDIAWILVTNGIEQLNAIDIASNKKEEARAAAAAANAARSERIAKKSANAAKYIPKAKPRLPTPTATRIEVVFQAQPLALVRILDDLAATNRFVVVEDFTFVRTADDLGVALTTDAKKEQSAESDRRRGRRRSSKEKAKADKDAAERRKGAVTDPETASPLRVTMDIAVYDFGNPPKPRQAVVPAEAEVGGEASTNGVEHVEKAAATNAVRRVVKAAATNAVRRVVKSEEVKE